MNALNGALRTFLPNARCPQLFIGHLFVYVYFFLPIIAILNFIVFIILKAFISMVIFSTLKTDVTAKVAAALLVIAKLVAEIEGGRVKRSSADTGP